MKNIFFVMNRKLNRAEILFAKTFNCWEMVQSALGVGIRMSDGNCADAIGRCHSLKEFCRKANHGNTTILIGENAPVELTIEVNGNRSKVSESIWRSWTGKRFLNGNPVKGQRFYFLTFEPYHGKTQDNQS